jgi:hypothetical protein
MMVFTNDDVKVGNASQLLLNIQSERTLSPLASRSCCAFFIHFVPENNFTSSLRVELHVKVS